MYTQDMVLRNDFGCVGAVVEKSPYQVNWVTRVHGIHSQSSNKLTLLTYLFLYSHVYNLHESTKTCTFLCIFSI